MLRSSSIHSLPVEIHLVIFSLLEAEDVVPLRQTCRGFYYTEQTFHRDIWSSCLARSTPTLFNIRDSEPIGSNTPRPLDCHVTAINGIPQLDTVILLPGGKYLLSFANGGNLAVWDLGTQLDTPGVPKLAANFAFGMDPGSNPHVFAGGGSSSCEFRSTQSYSFLYHLLDFTGLGTFVTSSIQTDVLEFYVVHELSFNESRGWNSGMQLRKLAALPIIRQYSPHSVCQDPVVCGFSNEVVTFAVDGVRIRWNFRNGTFAVAQRTSSLPTSETSSAKLGRVHFPDFTPLPREDILRVEKLARSALSPQTLEPLLLWRPIDNIQVALPSRSTGRKGPAPASLWLTYLKEGDQEDACSSPTAADTSSLARQAFTPALLATFPEGDSPLRWDFDAHSGRLIVAHSSKLSLHDYLRPYHDRLRLSPA
ncbi:hypothetical protein BKA70DRAFT_1422725 [Coprinopsis sp. MPI-PUGE-AT-0042]|nr:hypothetical protein BKA70DRAFT_1422725 [Coprinopsis sp. MPI-PUGE-AT-0042]